MRRQSIALDKGRATESGGLIVDFRLGCCMVKSEVLQLLKMNKAYLKEHYDVADLALFGSTARDETHADSDIDILVAFDGPATSKRFFGVQFYLEDLLNVSVDLVTEKALRPELRPYIEEEAIHV